MADIKKKPTVKPVETKKTKTDEQLAEEIVQMISTIINQRNGIGEVWRLLNMARKTEIKEKWIYEIKEILKNK
jgi:hypothetical protein